MVRSDESNNKKSHVQVKSDNDSMINATRNGGNMFVGKGTSKTKKTFSNNNG